MGPTGSVVFPVRHADASSWSTAAAPATRVLRCLGSRRGSATFWRAHNLYSVAHRLATSNHPRSGHHARARAAVDSQPQIHRWLSPIGSLGAWVGRASTSWSRSRRAAHGALQESPTNKCRSMSPSTAVTESPSHFAATGQNGLSRFEVPTRAVTDRAGCLLAADRLPERRRRWPDPGPAPRTRPWLRQS